MKKGILIKALSVSLLGLAFLSSCDKKEAKTTEATTITTTKPKEKPYTIDGNTLNMGSYPQGMDELYVKPVLVFSGRANLENVQLDGVYLYRFEKNFIYQN